MHYNTNSSRDKRYCNGIEIDPCRSPRQGWKEYIAIIVTSKHKVMIRMSESRQAGQIQLVDENIESDR